MEKGRFRRRRRLLSREKTPVRVIVQKTKCCSRVTYELNGKGVRVKGITWDGDLYDVLRTKVKIEGESFIYLGLVCCNDERGKLYHFVIRGILGRNKKVSWVVHRVSKQPKRKELQQLFQ
ncbi:MAG: hypothetical protein ACPGO5_03105 [Patescibacteria group bacterium]